jgi:hypothetical protein
MALLTLPIGRVIGLIVADGRRAVFLTLVIGLAALLTLGLAALRGVEVSPWETLVLVVGLPLAMLLASWGARVRQR